MPRGQGCPWRARGLAGGASGERDKRLRRARSVTGRIVYIHPQRRYFLAEAKVGNAVIRECFPMTPK